MRDFTILVTYAGAMEPRTYEIKGETLGQAIALFINTPQMISADFKSITDVTAPPKARTTARELVESIVEKKLAELRRHRMASNSRKIQAEAVNFETVATFNQYIKSWDEPREMNFSISEKQHKYLLSLLRKEASVVIDGVKFYPASPSVYRKNGPTQDWERYILKAIVLP